MMELATARDRRYDGRFLTGVVTTGIFCLPSCPARMPRPENVRFFLSPEAARAAGLRPCRRCTPDAFYAQRDPDRDVIEALVAEVRRAPDKFADVEAVAAASGFSRSKLHRLLRRHFHTGPAALLQRARVFRTRQLLQASRSAGRARSVLDVGLAAGYESGSSLHENFLSATGMTPGSYRRMLGGRAFMLELPPDFHVASTWRYLGRDAERTTEWVEGTTARRVLRHGRYRAVVELEQRGRRMAVQVLGKATPSPGAMAAFHDQLWRWLGLSALPASFERRAGRQRGWRALLSRQRGLRLPQTPTVFEGLVWAMVGQQVNLAFAYRLRRVLAELCQARAKDGLRGHPTAAEVARLDYVDLTRRQFSQRKAEYVIDAARLASGRRGGLEPWAGQAASRVAADLVAIRGVGEWTQQYVLMRACGFADCVPVGDAGLVKALQLFHGLDARPGAAQTRALMAPLAPHRSLATAHLWASLHQDSGGTA